MELTPETQAARKEYFAAHSRLMRLLKRYADADGAANRYDQATKMSEMAFQLINDLSPEPTMVRHPKYDTAP